MKKRISQAIKDEFEGARSFWVENTLYVDITGEEHILSIDFGVPGLSDDELVENILEALR